MKRSKVTAAFSITSLIIVFALTAAAGPPQVRTAPPPVISHQKDPQADVQSPQKPDQFTVIEFTIWTGDDDLRSDSSAWINLVYPGGVYQRCDLRAVDGDTWSNNSRRDALCTLPSPKSYDELKATTMRLAYNGHPGQGDVGLQTFAHNMDNWTVNGVRIEAKNLISQTHRCLIYAHGDPLVRMTGSRESYDLKETASAC